MNKHHKGAPMVNAVEEYEDGRSCNKRAVRDITQKWVEHHMDTRVSDFTTKTTGSIFIGTWNVNAKKQEEGLHEWLLPPDNAGNGYADIYAVGFQEIVDLNATNVMMDGSKTAQRSTFWQEKIEESLATIKRSKRYTLVASKALVGLLLCVYASDAIMPSVKDVRTAHQATGLMGVMGNKGGVCIRMSVYDTSLCFVCTHLAAHRENVVGRNADFKTILEGVVFPLSAASASAKEAEAAAAAGDEELIVNDMVIRPLRGAALNQTQPLTLLDHHEMLFWMGDLNYRIDESITTDEVFLKIEQNKLNELRPIDQLNIERAKGNAFQGFDEGELNFIPTYKYQPGTDNYDRRPDKKIRAPAWCDRILWRNTLPGETYKILQNCYKRAALTPSDHKPVYAHFTVDYRVLIEEQERKVYNDVMKSLEFWKNDDIPRVEVSRQLIDMGPVKFDVPATQEITITNTGSAIAYWRFIHKLEDGPHVGKRWLSVGTKSGLLLPNESYTVSVTVKVDTTTAQGLNSGREVLEDVLALRLEYGHDTFIPVTAAYQRSCFGMSLEALVDSSSKPVREIPLPAFVPREAMLRDNGVAAEVQLLQEAQAVAQEAITNTPMSLPKELWRLVDALWSGNAMKEKDLFATPGVPEEVLAIREALDCGTAFTTPCSPHSYAQCLVDFLKALPVPLVPIDFYPVGGDLSAENIRPHCRKILDGLLPLNYNAFVYLIAFFHEVLNQREYNRSTLERLTEVCLTAMTSSASPNLFLGKDEVARRLNRRLRMRVVFACFLSNDAI